MSEAWRAEAACRNRTATMFDSEQHTTARSLCDGCPVGHLCLWACLREEDPSHRYGMVGGMTPSQRAALAARLPFAVIEAAHDAAVTAWQVRHGVTALDPITDGALRLEPAAAPPPSSPTPTIPTAPTEDPMTDEIITAVAAAFAIAPEQLLGSSRTRHVVDARQVAMYVLREARGLSYPAIGAALGRDHTTAMHGVERVRARMAEQPALLRGVLHLMSRLAGGMDAPPEDATTEELSIASAKDRTDGSLPDGNADATRAVLDEVARVCGVRVEEIRGRARTRHVAEARQVAMYALRAVRGFSYPAIGRAVGGRDHTTAMHGVARVRRDMAACGAVGKRAERVIEALGGPAAQAA